MVTFTPNILHPWILIPLCSLGYPIFLSTHQKWKFASFFNFNNNDKIFILGLHCSPPPNPSVQFSSVTQLCLTLCNPIDCSMPGFPVHHQLKLMSIKSVIPSNHLILCHPLFLFPPIFHSIRVCSNESFLRIRWPQYWNFSFSISPSNEYSGLISFRIDWFDLLGVQETLKNLLQHHSSKASILQLSAFLKVQLSHPYMTTRKIKALTRWVFVGKVMSLVFNLLSRFVIAFLSRNKHLLVSCL